MKVGAWVRKKRDGPGEPSVRSPMTPCYLKRNSELGLDRTRGHEMGSAEG